MWERWMVYRHAARIDKPAELLGCLLDLWYKFRGLDEQQCTQQYYASIQKTSRRSSKHLDEDKDPNNFTVELQSSQPVDNTAERVSDSGSDTEIESRDIGNFIGNDKTFHEGETVNQHLLTVSLKHEQPEITTCLNEAHNDHEDIADFNIKTLPHTPTVTQTESPKLLHGKRNRTVIENIGSSRSPRKRTRTDETVKRFKQKKVSGNLDKSEELDDRDVESDTSYVPDMAGTKGGAERGQKHEWIKIKLEDHGDKYRLETFESFAQKDRKNNVCEELFCCLVCKQFKCASKDNIEEHIEKHVNKALECDVCDYVAFSDRDLNLHKYDSGHTHKKKFVCDMCGVILYSPNARKLHMGTIHNLAQFCCKFCSETFQSQKIRDQHMRSEHEEKSQFCPTCKKLRYALSKEAFQRHLEVCQMNHARQCQICGAKFNHVNSFRRHMQDIHLGIRKFKCEICPYTAKTTKRLASHTLTHTGTHPYSCDQCTFTCVQRTQLLSHMRTHSGEKPFRCTQCKYSAAWNVQLKDHIKVHCMESAVLCQCCDILFKNEKTLNMHLKKEHYK